MKIRTKNQRTKETAVNDDSTIGENYFDDLPTEMLLHILSFMDIEQRFLLKRVCKRFQDTVKRFPVKSLNFYASFTLRFSKKYSEEDALDNAKRVLREIGPNLRTLTIKTKNHLQVPMFCTNLISLEIICDDYLTKAFFKSLASKCKHLEDLSLAKRFDRFFFFDQVLSEEGLQILLKKCTIKKLNIRTTRNVKGGFLEDLSPQTESLNLQGCSSINTRSLHHIKNCKAIKALNVADLGHCELDDILNILISVGSTLECLGLGNIRDLYRESVPVYRLDLSSVFRCFNKLKQLYLPKQNFLNDEAMYTLTKNSPLLEALCVCKAPKVTDLSCSYLAKLRLLKYLDISENESISEHGLEEICAIDRLKVLVVSKNKLGNGMCAKLLQNLMDLEILNAEGCTGLSSVPIIGDRKHSLTVYCSTSKVLECKHLPNFNVILEWFEVRYPEHPVCKECKMIHELHCARKQLFGFWRWTCYSACNNWNWGYRLN